MGEKSKPTPRISILVVDDNESVRVAISEILKQAGYRVTQASDAKTALSLMGQQPPDLVITDIFMPEGDGFDLLNEVRRQALSIPVIVVSGGGMAVGGDFLGFASHLGAAVILQKPLKPRQLLDAVAQALNETNREPE